MSQSGPANSLGHARSDQRQSDFRLLVDGIQDYGIFMLDPDGIVLTWNSGARRMNGYTADEIIGRQFSTFYPPSDVAAGKPALELQAALAGGSFEAEGWRLRKDGSRFWANVVLTALRDEQGQLRGFGKVTRDLTERRGRDTKYRLLVESVRDYAIVMLDLKGVVCTWNAGGEAINGYKPGEIIGKSFATFYTQADIDRKHPQHELRCASRDGRFEDEGWRVRKDGTLFWANVVISALHDDDGTLLGYSKVIRDLTERRAAEERLRESEERFRLMVEGVKDYAIIILDPAGMVVSWNAGAERIKGWKAEEIIGQSFNRFYPPEDVERGKTAMELKTAAELGSFEDFGWRLRKDGKRFWANVVITALRDEQGQLRGFGKVTRDITERKNAEESLRKAFEELESFSYAVSHDLQAPLRSMDGFSDELCVLYEDKLDARGKDYLGRIRQSAQRMSRLIDDLLNLSRLGRARLNRDDVDMSALARKVIGELIRLEPQRKVEVVVAPDLKVNADESLLRVVLENLLGNAWKYTSHHPTGRIEVGVSRPDGTPVYFVRDDGAGFDMTYTKKLFGAFQRLHASDQFPGTGIGLATVKRIVQRHGGSVSATGAIEAGATFTFTLGEVQCEANK
jgi:PAS domain S-box-containing protein